MTMWVGSVRWGRWLMLISSVRAELTTCKLTNRRGQHLHCYYWQTQRPPRCLVLLSHGFSEHLGIYKEIAQILGTRSPSPHSNCMSCSSGQRLSRVRTRPHRPWGEWREESLHRECGPLRGRHHSPLHGAEGELLNTDTWLTVWPGEVQGAAHLHHRPQHGRHDSAEVSPQTPGILLRHDPQRASCHPRASGHA